MTGFFVTVLNMSIVASYVILLILPVRLLLRKAPTILTYALWGVVLFRLLCPVSFESAFSFLAVSPNSAFQDMVSPPLAHVESGMGPLDNNRGNLPLAAGASVTGADPIQMALTAVTVVWAVGVAVILLRSAVSTLGLHRVLRGCRHVGGNVYECGAIDSPFVFGIVHPRIYLSPGLGEGECKMVILHEQAHIRRKDHIAKLLFFLALCIHWFNPLVWVAFRCMSRDMEMCCDERVMDRLGAGEKQQYSKALLAVAAGRSPWSVGPIAFGESDVKGRVKNILSYKKPVLWVSIAAFLAVALAGIGFMANPISAKTTYWHCHFHTLEPEGRPYVTDIYFEISRYGYPEDHIDAYVKNLLFSMMEPPTSYGYDITQLDGRDALNALYTAAIKEGKIVAYSIVDDSDSPLAEDARYLGEDPVPSVPDKGDAEPSRQEAEPTAGTETDEADELAQSRQTRDEGEAALPEAPVIHNPDQQPDAAAGGSVMLEFDPTVLGRLDQMSQAEVDALALEYIDSTGDIGYVYNMSPYMSVAGRDAAAWAYLSKGGDIGLVGAMLQNMSPTAAKEVAEKYEAEKQDRDLDWIFAPYL